MRVRVWGPPQMETLPTPAVVCICTLRSAPSILVVLATQQSGAGTGLFCLTNEDILVLTGDVLCGPKFAKPVAGLFL